MISGKFWQYKNYYRSIYYAINLDRSCLLVKHDKIANKSTTTEAKEK